VNSAPIARIPGHRTRWRFAPAALILLLGVALLVPSGVIPGLRLANPDRSRSDTMRTLIAALPPSPLVLVGFDPDLGTYPEIRGTVRAVFDDLAAHGGRLAFVSFTAEGRALAAAEMDRLARTGAFGPAALLDIGFVAGAEAGMVRAVTDVIPTSADGALAVSARARGAGIGAFDLVLIVSGGDISARSWVEQVASRLRGVRMVAVAPTFLEPELAPYLRSGQLQALLATLRDGVAYAAEVAADSGAGDRPIGVLPILVGMLVTLVWMAVLTIQRLTGRVEPRSQLGGPA